MGYSVALHVEEADAAMVGQLFVAARKIAAEQGVAKDGYRLIINCNEHC